jgi:hypothetical protein
VPITSFVETTPRPGENNAEAWLPWLHCNWKHVGNNAEFTVERDYNGEFMLGGYGEWVNV